MIASASFLLLLAQGTDPLVSYETVAAPLGRAMQELGQKAGVKLEVGPEISGEPIIIRLNGVPLNTARKKIADTVRAEWQPLQGGGFRLVRPADLVQKLRREQVAYWADIVAEHEAVLRRQVENDGEFTRLKASAIAAMIARLIQPGDEPRDGQLEAALRTTLTPANRALYRFLGNLDPNVLASVLPGQRKVFSNKPTAMEEELPEAVMRAFAAYVTEHNTLAPALMAVLPKPNLEKVAKEGGTWFEPPFPVYWMRETISGTADRIVLVVDHTPGGDNYRIELGVYDANGKGLMSIEPDIFLPSWTLPQGKWESLVTESRNSPTVPLSSIARTYIALAKTPPSRLSKDDVETLRSPEKLDPLGHLISESCLFWAKQDNLNAVIYPSDMMFFAAAISLQKDEIPLSLFKSFVRMYAIFNTTEGNGWLTIAPSEPLTAIETRTNRAALGNLLKRQASDGRVTLASALDFARDSNNLTMPGLAFQMQMLMREHREPNWDPYVLAVWDWSALKLSASLSEDEKTAAQMAGGLRFGALGPDSQFWVSDLLYQRSDTWFSEARADSMSSGAELIARKQMAEQLPTGLGLGLVMRVTSSSPVKYLALYRSVAGQENKRLVTLDEVARELAVSRPHPSADQITGLEEVVVREVEFTLTPDSKFGSRTFLREIEPVDGRSWTIGQLPDDLKGKLQLLISNYRGPGGN